MKYFKVKAERTAQWLLDIANELMVRIEWTEDREAEKEIGDDFAR